MSKVNKIIAEKDVKDAQVGIVCSRFNRRVVDRLQEACIQKLIDEGIAADKITLVEVPGAFEIPVAAQRLLANRNCDAVITLGAVIRGETPHFDYICEQCSKGIAELALKNDIPVIFGVLTVDTIEQAEQRSGTEESNKGAESALAALHMISTLRNI